MLSSIQPVPDSANLASTTHPLRVLIAEDDPLLAEVLLISLEQLGCFTKIAVDGQEAIEQLEKDPFDILISDWMMPRVDGLELVRSARADRSRYLHIIMMTARGQERSMRAALDAGADDFLYKPFEPIQIELGIAAARRVVELQRRLESRARHLAAAHKRTRSAYRQIKDDLVAAAAMQRRLLPEQRTEGPVRIAYHFQPSLDIGGDSLGVRTLGNGRLLFFNIDVSGHGIPAALNSFTIHSRLMQVSLSEPEELPAVADILNWEMLSQAGDTYFTAVLGLVEPDGSKLWLTRAGHPMPLLLRRGHMPHFLEEGGIPLGMFPEAPHKITEIILAKGDRLLIYSDGVTDLALGEAGLVAACVHHNADDPQSLVAGIDRLLSDAREGRPPEDDVSLLLIERAEG